MSDLVDWAIAHGWTLDSQEPTEAEVEAAAKAIMVCAVDRGKGAAVLPPTWNGWHDYARAALTAAHDSVGLEHE